MLVLSRKCNEEITIGDDIKITIVRVQGNKVRLGISAPRDVAIVRGELTADCPATGITIDTGACFNGPTAAHH